MKLGFSVTEHGNLSRTNQDGYSMNENSKRIEKQKSQLWKEFSLIMGTYDLLLFCTKRVGQGESFTIGL